MTPFFSCEKTPRLLPLAALAKGCFFSLSLFEAAKNCQNILSRAQQMAPSLSGCDSLQDVANGLVFTQLREKKKLGTSGNDGSFSIIENLLSVSSSYFLFLAKLPNWTTSKMTKKEEKLNKPGEVMIDWSPFPDKLATKD